MNTLPVMIEDMIKKVTNPQMHPEQRQHWANTLYAIIEESEKALKIYESHRKTR